MYQSPFEQLQQSVEGARPKGQKVIHEGPEFSAVNDQEQAYAKRIQELSTTKRPLTYDELEELDFATKQYDKMHDATSGAVGAHQQNEIQNREKKAIGKTKTPLATLGDIKKKYPKVKEVE